jgi:hypothetical protein
VVMIITVDVINVFRHYMAVAIKSFTQQSRI